MLTPMHHALLPAVLIEGSFAGVARRLGVTRQAMNYWLHTHKIPHAQMVALHRRYRIPYAKLIEGAPTNG